VSAFCRGAKTLEKLFCREQSQKYETRWIAKHAAESLLDVMATPFTNRHRNLFIVLFFIFEALYVSSDVIIYCTDSPFQPELLNAAAQVTFMYSFVGLLIASFLLRQSARHLANIGWITLFGIVFIQMLTPRL
jgi:hypothetical protein